MTVRDSLRPRKPLRVMDLVAAAGVDVQPWATSSRGPVCTPAANPRYCYEWAFMQPGRVIVLNVWHKQLREENGNVWCDLNLRAWSETGRQTKTLLPSERAVLSMRAIRTDNAIAYAFNNGLPVRVIVGEGLQRDISNPQSQKASRMKLRLLDPKPWSIQYYDQNTGECRLIRGTVPRYVDQYTAPEPRLPARHEVTGRVWDRDHKVRDAALFRAKGNCEFCGQPGFRTADGGIYLETHHVIPLSENGGDDERNVAALCPNDHREAHHGERRDEIRMWLLAMLSK